VVCRVQTTTHVDTLCLWIYPRLVQIPSATSAQVSSREMLRLSTPLLARPSRSRAPTSLQALARGFGSTPPARIPKIPLWINGKALTMSSGGSVTVRHSKTRQPSCELVVAGEEETWVDLGSSSCGYRLWFALRLTARNSRQAVEGSWQAFERWGIVPAWERRRVISKVWPSVNSHSLLHLSGGLSCGYGC
jgi:hypothetical protein